MSFANSVAETQPLREDGGTPEPRSAGLPLELEEGAVDTEGGIPTAGVDRDEGLDMDGKPSLLKSASMALSGFFASSKGKGADGGATPGVSFDPALGDGGEQQGGKKGGGNEGPSGLEKVLGSVMHEPGSLKPAAFAANRSALVKERQANKKSRKLRTVFRRETPYYQTHFADSDKPCVGVAPKKYCKCNPTFVAHTEWAVRAAIAATLAAAPSFFSTIRREVDWDKCHDTLYECSGWANMKDPSTSSCVLNPTFMKSACSYSCRSHPGFEDCNHDLTWLPNEDWVPDLDPSYAAVVCILAFGYTAGETHRFLWELIAGVIAAAIIPQIAVLTFGASWQVAAIFIFCYATVFICMPVDVMTKKFSLGLCVQYMCTRSLWEERDWEWTDHWTTYHVAKIGIYGAICALFMQLLPFPRTARGEAHRCLNSVAGDIMISLAHMVQGFCDGQTKQEKTKALVYTDHITRQLMQLEQFLTFAWWEPGSSTAVYKFKVCAATMHKCRANLYGMQQALSKWDNDENRKAMEDAKPTLLQFSTSAMETLDGLLHFMVEGELEDYVDHEVEQDDESRGRSLWHIVRRKITHREAIERKIKQHIPGYPHLERQMRSVNWVFSEMRAQLAESREDGHRLEEDEQLHLFMMSLTSFGQALLSFPEEYAEAHEARTNESKSDEFIPESSLVTIYFQKRHLIAAIKTGAAIVMAFLCNIWLFDFESLAPVVISYVMAGHSGGSYANTASRCLGILTGMIVSFFFIISTSCDPVGLAFGYFLIIFAASYVRIASPTSTYTALVTSVVSSQLMVHQCTEEMDLQFAMSRQLVLACFVMAIAEFGLFLVPTWYIGLDLGPTNSLTFLQTQVADTLLETRVVFLEVFQTHLSDTWANIERKAYVANMFAKGVIEEYKPDKRASKLVDNSLWRNLPIYINSQEVLMEQCWDEPSFHRPAFPKTAYDQLISLNRRTVLYLTVIENHLAESGRKREETRELIDEARRELNELRDSLVAAMDELAQIVRRNKLDDSMRRDNEESDEFFQAQPQNGRHMVASEYFALSSSSPSNRSLETLLYSREFQSVHPPLWRNLSQRGLFSDKSVAGCADSQKFKLLAANLHQFNLESNAELHRRLNSGVADLTNDELFTFHAVRAMLNELVSCVPSSCDSARSVHTELSQTQTRLAPASTLLARIADCSRTMVPQRCRM